MPGEEWTISSRLSNVMLIPCCMQCCNIWLSYWQKPQLLIGCAFWPCSKKCWQGPKVLKEYCHGVSTSLTSTESQRAKECDAEQPATKEACCKRVPLFTHCCYNCRGTSLLQGTIFDRVQIVKENRNWTQYTSGTDHIANVLTVTVQQSWKQPFQLSVRTTIFGFYHRKGCL